MGLLSHIWEKIYWTQQTKVILSPGPEKKVDTQQYDIISTHSSITLSPVLVGRELLPPPGALAGLGPR